MSRALHKDRRNLNSLERGSERGARKGGSERVEMNFECKICATNEWHSARRRVLRNAHYPGESNDCMHVPPHKREGSQPLVLVDRKCG